MRDTGREGGRSWAGPRDDSRVRTCAIESAKRNGGESHARRAPPSRISLTSMPVKYLFYSDTFSVRPYAPEGYTLRCVKKDSTWRPSCAYCDSTLAADRRVRGANSLRCQFAAFVGARAHGLAREVLDAPTSGPRSHGLRTPRARVLTRVSCAGTARKNLQEASTRGRRCKAHAGVPLPAAASMPPRLTLRHSGLAPTATKRRMTGTRWCCALRDT